MDRNRRDRFRARERLFPCRYVNDGPVWPVCVKNEVDLVMPYPALTKIVKLLSRIRGTSGSQMLTRHQWLVDDIYESLSRTDKRLEAAELSPGGGYLFGMIRGIKYQACV